jgi:hypothetical protein
MSDPLHLLVPYAVSHSAGGQHALKGLALPHLDRLLARLSPHTAHTDTGEETSFSAPHERALAQALGLPVEDGRIPWAAWHRHQQGLPTDGQAWAFVTPCQWHVSTDHITLRDPDSLALDEAASRALLAIVAPWFAEDGITLHYDRPTRWLASGALFVQLATASLERVLQRDVRPWMPDPRTARTLHRLHSEMQMLLYTHPVNEAREQRGALTVNSIWLSGTGALPESYPAPASAQPIMAPTLRQAALQDDWAGWASAWQQLDATHIRQLLDAQNRGDAVQLTLCGERHAQSWVSRPPTLTQKFRQLFSAPPVQGTLEKL